MRKTVAIAVILLALLCVLAWVLSGGDPKPRRQVAQGCEPAREAAPRVRASNMQSQPAPANTPSASAAEQTPKPVEEKARPKALLFVAGKITSDANGAAVVDAEVTLRLKRDPKDATKTRTGADGAFHFELPGVDALTADAVLIVRAAGFKNGGREAQAGEGNDLALAAEDGPTVIVVRMEGTKLLPENCWLAWERYEGKRPGGSYFEDNGQARIELKPEHANAGKCRAGVQWFGKVLESEWLEVKWGTEQTVTLKPPEGASVKVRVLDHASKAMAGVRVLAEGDNIKEIAGITDAAGEALFTHIPTPVDLSFDLEGNRDAEICVHAQGVKLVSPGDYKEVIFDLTGSGIVEVEFKAGEEEIYSLIATAAQGDLTPHSIWLWRFRDDTRVSRILGLPPGRYKVTVDVGRDAEFETECAVVAPPEISKWQKDFTTGTVIVRARGYAQAANLKAERWVPSTWPGEDLKANESGEFTLKNLSEKPVYMRIWGEGRCSRVFKVDSSSPPEIEVDLESAGTLKFMPRQAGMEQTLEITDLEAKDGVPLRIDVGRNSKPAPNFATLPPGRYRIRGNWEFKVAPWEPIEVTVRAGEETEVKVGPEFTSVLTLRVTDRTDLWEFKVEILKGDQLVKHSMVMSHHGGDEFHQLRFEGEGKLKLKISREGYETIEKEFEVKRGEEAKLEITPKRR